MSVSMVILKRRNSTEVVAMGRKEFPIGHDVYELHEEIGKGGAATVAVYRVFCFPLKEEGDVKIGDLGVSSCLLDSGDRQHKINTITALQGHLAGWSRRFCQWKGMDTTLKWIYGRQHSAGACHAPFSEYPPVKELQVQQRALLKKLPSTTLGESMKALLKVKKVEDMLAHDKLSEVQKEEISQKEYLRGICDWNFNIEGIKLQAALIEEVREETVSAEILPEMVDDFGGRADGQILQQRGRFKLQNDIREGTSFSYLGQRRSYSDLLEESYRSTCLLLFHIVCN
ncbi:hypothetical protein IFM89_029461 [Coptis chinensis]|uniref:Uncharacterized protein n=1 Tax=Coptis chinensis TaxID=261450 RepID=A0A835LVT3_9MAGN|nr:hypothetical protein IFM89_029461 [Coptis chinensis]